MKKEPLSIMTVKTLLAVVIFAGVGTIIIGGGYIIGEYSKICDNHPFSSEESFLSKKVILKTDKVEYSTGESIELTVENNSEETVFLAEKPSGFSYPEPILEKYEDGVWAGYEWHSYYLFSEYHILRFICHKIQDETKIGLLIQNKYTEMLLPEGKYRVALIFGKSCNGQNSAADTNNGLIDSFVVYSNEFEIRKSQRDNNLTMSIITNKKEYQKDEEVKLTISNLNRLCCTNILKADSTQFFPNYPTA